LLLENIEVVDNAIHKDVITVNNDDGKLGLRENKESFKKENSLKEENKPGSIVMQEMNKKENRILVFDRENNGYKTLPRNNPHKILNLGSLACNVRHTWPKF